MLDHAVSPSIVDINFTIIVAQINPFSKVRNLKDFAQRDHFQKWLLSLHTQCCQADLQMWDRRLCQAYISSNFQGLKSFGGTGWKKAFDYCIMTKSAFIRLALSSLCLDVMMEGGYLGTQNSFGMQLALSWTRKQEEDKVMARGHQWWSPAV